MVVRSNGSKCGSKVGRERWISKLWSEAKGQGFDTKIMRQVVRLRKLETADRQEQEAMLDLYLSALGMRRG